MIFAQLKLYDYKTFEKKNFDKDLMCNINISSNYAQFSELFKKVP